MYSIALNTADLLLIINILAVVTTRLFPDPVPNTYIIFICLCKAILNGHVYAAHGVWS